MRGVVIAFCVGAASTAAAQPSDEPAAATEDAAPATAPTPDVQPRDVSSSHQGQFQLSARLAFGLRGIATYEGSTYCGDIDTSTSSGFAPVCTGRSPLVLDLEVGYGVGRTVDVFLELRFGLETDFGATPATGDGPRPFHLSPGARFFFSESGKAKVFTTAQLVLDFAGYQNSGGGDLGTDFGVRNMSGLWFDVDRRLGFYVYVGETATFSRWLRFELEGGVGVQGRYK